MKRPSFRSNRSRSSGFTLVELLVVIGIIAILASVLFPVVGSALNAAKRSKANVTINQIQTSTLAYFNEYSVYPIYSPSTPVDVVIGDTSSTDGASWAALIYCLSGNLHPSTSLSTPVVTTAPSNNRAIPFLTMKPSDVYTTTTNGTVVDAPKNPLPSSTTGNIYFNIAMDGDYDNVLGVSPSAVTSMPNFASPSLTSLPSTGGNGGSSSAGVAVWANCNGTSSGTNPAFWVHTY